MQRQSQNNINANIEYHTKLADIYDESQPHFKLENQKIVDNILNTLSKKTSGQRLLDMGCGTGFILSLARKHFKELVGVDITPAMLKKARIKFEGNQKNIKIKLIEASTDDLPFKDNYFDVVTGYSFLHHLSSLTPTLKEAYRVLKNGGVLYTDLDPNYYFWEIVSKIAKQKNSVSEELQSDINTICNMTQEVSNMVDDLKPQIIRNAEYIECHDGGFKEEEIINDIKSAGFKNVNLVYHWFWKQGKVIHETSQKNSEYFERHLQNGLPMTRILFKYFRIIAYK